MTPRNIILEDIMKTVRLTTCGLIVMLLPAIWNVGQAQDSLGMSCLSSLNYWQNADMIQMVGDLAYVVAGGSGLHIMSLEDPAHPVEIGRFTWYHWSVDGGGVYVIGNRAYLGIANGGFVLDVSDPTHPVTLGQWTSTRGSCISFAHGDFAVAETREGYPYVLDVSDPTNVHYVGDLSVGGPGEGVGMAGEYLCLTGSPGGLVLFDMSNPADPRWVASIDTVFTTWHATISGNYGYLATLYNGLRIIDLSNPLQPVEIAACDSSGWTYDVAVTGSHAVLLKSTVSYTWLDIWNVADPAHPVLEGMIPVHIFGWYRVSGSGNLVCTAMAGPNYAVMVVDISNPAEPVEVSSFGPRAILTRMAIDDNTAYMADRATGFRTVDIADPYHMSELAHMNAICAEGLDVATRGNYAYVTEDQWGEGTNGVVIFDVSNPAEPESLGYVLPEGGRKIVIAGDYAYVAGHYLCTFSLANPAIPQCVDSLYLGAPDDCIGLAVSNGYLYFGDISSFYVYSLSNPAAPQLVGSCDLQYGWVYDLAVADRYVYVADGSGGMRVVNVGDPEHPEEVHSIGGGFVASVATVGNMVIMDDRSRISIYDVTNPLAPALVGFYSTAEHIRDIEIQGQYLFAVSESAFRVYECDALTSAAIQPETTPHEFALYPCYPNPFNSTLVIPFSLPMQTEATISIYNILGQKVYQFASPPLSPGAHQVLWNATSRASGIYLVRMYANGAIFSQKTLLLK